MFETAVEAQECGQSCFELAAHFISQTTDILTRLNRFKDPLAEGNLRIYEYLAPNFVTFIVAANPADNGLPENIAYDDDPTKYLSTAFTYYSEARRIGLEMSPIGSSHSDYKRLEDARLECVDQANFLVVYNEQLYRAQPLYDQISTELHELTRAIIVDDPSGSHHLLPSYPGASWGNLFQRMGMDPLKTGDRCPQEIDPACVFNCRLDPHSNHAIGSIAQFFHQASHNSGLYACLRTKPGRLP